MQIGGFLSIDNKVETSEMPTELHSLDNVKGINKSVDCDRNLYKHVAEI